MRDARHGSGPAARRLAALAVAALVACQAPRAYVPKPGRYDRLPDAWATDLQRARAALGEDQHALARELLRALAEERPQALPVRVLLQEAELAALTRAVAASEPPEDPDPSAEVTHAAEARRRLAQVYREQATTRDGAEDWVLAARLAASGEEALALLETAQERDAECVWVHYARAWWLTRLRRFPEARRAIERAFALDGGHAPTMRLHASLKARAGDRKAAIQCLRAWLARTAADPLEDPGRRAEAQVDLAALLAYGLESEEALRELGRVHRVHLTDPARADLVEAVAQADLGRTRLALAACRRARLRGPDGRLALVDQALLHEAQGAWERELETWRTLLAELEAAPGAGAPEEDLAWMLVRMQALARVTRLTRQMRNAAESP